MREENNNKQDTSTKQNSKLKGQKSKPQLKSKKTAGILSTKIYTTHPIAADSCWGGAKHSLCLG